MFWMLLLLLIVSLMNNIFITVLIFSLLNAQFFEDKDSFVVDSKLSLKDSLPSNMPVIKNIFWSENGVFRKFNLSPDNRLQELKLRRSMMQWHQKIALVNLGLMSYQYYIGHNMNDDYTKRSDLHRKLGYTSFGLYMTSAGLSVFSPPALKYDKGLSAMNIHRLLSIVHFSGMLAQPWLGYKISNSCHGDYYMNLHEDVGNVVFASYLLSFILTLIP